MVPLLGYCPTSLHLHVDRQDATLADRSPRPSLRPVLQLAPSPCSHRSSSSITSPTTSSSLFALSLIVQRISIDRNVVVSTFRGSTAAPTVLELRVELLGAELGVVQHPLHA
eukprot:6773227-Heterocapsa_arctica.AAC.1